MDAVMDLYRKHGVKQDGALTALEWGMDVPLRGKDVIVTTSLHADQERELVGLMREAAAGQVGRACRDAARSRGRGVSAA
jgi:hypothetical protein